MILGPAPQAGPGEAVLALLTWGRRPGCRGGRGEARSRPRAGVLVYARRERGRECDASSLRARGRHPPGRAAWAPAVGRVGLGPALLSLFPHLFLLHGAGCLSVHGAAGAAGRGHSCARVGLATGALERGGLPSSARCHLRGALPPLGCRALSASPCSTSAGGGPPPGGCSEQQHPRPELVPQLRSALRMTAARSWLPRTAPAPANGNSVIRGTCGRHLLGVMCW